MYWSGDGHDGRQILIPRKNPLTSKLNERAAIRQLTLSYRLLPFYSRSAVGWRPYFEPDGSLDRSNAIPKSPYILIRTTT